LKLAKFVDSDEGLPCVNTVEKIYLGLLIAVFALGILSLFRLTHFKADLRKVFDPRNEVFYKWFLSFFLLTGLRSFRISNKRLKWHGIESLEESKPEILNAIYGEECVCEFDSDGDFKCNCQWHNKIMLEEHKSFLDLRIVSKPGIHRSHHSIA